jgi:CheY-like chemotaxis protein/anti-sigma regulatory factor (Ser/Thr protein kinase)
MRLAESSGLVSVPTRPRRRRKALVVDDDASARFMLKSLLTRSGYDVSIATNGRDALEMFRSNPSDIVFMDLYMPHMDGLESAHQIKALSVREFVPVIFVSGAADTQDLVRGIEAGGDDFLTKPYDELVLKAKIRALERIRTLHRNSARLHERARADWEVAQSLLAEVVMGGNPQTSALLLDLTPTDAFSADVALAAYSPSGDMNILLGDFTGHGLAAALAALPTAEIFRSMTAKGFAPQQILLEINRKLKGQLPVGKFLAAAFVQVSDSLERVWVANCGMPDVLVLGTQGVKERISSGALPLGVQADLDLGSCMRLINVRRGDRLLLASDGIHEATNERGEQFGIDRLEQAARVVSGASTAHRVKIALDEFRGDEPIADDSSLVEVQLVPELFAPRAQVEARRSECRDSTATGQWRLALELHGDALRVTDPVPMLLSQLQQVSGLDAHRCVLYTVLSELYSNALDHGVLQLNSRLKDEPNGFERYLQAREQQLEGLSAGWVAIRIVCSRWPHGGQLTVETEDSGAGFDWRGLPTDVPTCGAHGRGLHLVRGLCQTLSFEGTGNKARAVYVWGDPEQTGVTAP